MDAADFRALVCRECKEESALFVKTCLVGYFLEINNRQSY